MAAGAHRYDSPVRRMAAALVAAVLAVLAGCSSGGQATSLPAGSDLLARSAQAMSQVTSTHIAVQVDPGLTFIPVRSLTADLTRAGDAKGTGQLSQFGVLVEVEFVVVGGSLYLKGPTGGFQKLPASSASVIYDPSAVLDPNRGVAKLLSTATEAQTEARDPVNGRDAYRVHAAFDPQVESALVPGLFGHVSGALWVDAANAQLLQARFDVPAQQGRPAGPVQVVLSNLNVPVAVAPPPATG